MLQELEEAGIPVHGVFGNNDGDQYLLTKLSLTSLKNIVLHGLIGEVDADGFLIAFTHQGMVGRVSPQRQNIKWYVLVILTSFLKKGLGTPFY